MGLNPSRFRATGAQKRVDRTMQPSREKIALSPRALCETFSGNLAHAVGRLAFRPGRPMLVEHVGGLYLEHDLSGRVMTPGYGREYEIVHIVDDNGEGGLLCQLCHENNAGHPA